MSNPAREAITWAVVAGFMWIMGGIFDVVDDIAPFVALAVAFSIFFTGVDYIVKAIEKSKK